ncbi:MULTISPECIES: hypothetical protein [unclassified Pseudomonas]|uniref:hypothetical protein n=1 Tax=unclassified Pseudomonas TaxID=196821 RepID=UPI002B221DCD|nr:MULTISPECIES: hypothetical protein [unclassified Pseudomonas]MEA9975581.1 hypothetical protein [Pseudomonas sp. RTS4]MEB0198829.1 hypothetical protein [Pseudomonas sp. 5S4]MEB0245143.1 hypothetical protein [Pseudomonas sp. 10S5]
MNSYQWLAAAGLAVSFSTHASTSFQPIELKDQELAQLRGRYVMPDRIVYFGLTMTSTWQNAAGEVLGAKTTLDVQQNIIKPQFYVSLVNQKGNGATPINGTGSITGGAGLNTIQGVAQSTRTAGDSNNSSNNVDISIQQNGQVPPTVTNQGQLLNSGATISTANGAGALSVSAVNGGVQLAIQGSNNQGDALQRIAAGGVSQAVNLIGSGNQVQNLTQLNIVLGNELPSAGSLNNSLEQLKGLRSLGY